MGRIELTEGTVTALERELGRLEDRLADEGPLAGPNTRRRATLQRRIDTVIEQLAEAEAER